MSTFLSNKFLKYRNLLNQAPQPIDRDLACTNCGYNLRGLITGRRCPECGQQISLTRLANDPLLAGQLSERRRVQIGLTLAMVCPAIVALARVGFGIAWGFQRGTDSLVPYISGCIGAGALWASGVWLLTDRRLQLNHPRLTWMRLTARLTQPLWLAAYVFWLLAETRFAMTPTGDRLLAYALLCSVPAATGAVATGAWLVVLAEDAGLNEAADRMNLSMCVIAVLALMMALIPLDLPFFFVVLMMVIFLPWAWYMIQFSRGLLELQRHVSWAVRLSLDDPDRAGRIDQTRQRLDSEAATVVRPLPKPEPRPDVPINQAD